MNATQAAKDFSLKALYEMLEFTGSELSRLDLWDEKNGDRGREARQRSRVRLTGNQKALTEAIKIKTEQA